MTLDATPRLSVAGVPVAPWRGRFGWAMFDWANQPYFTLVITFIFAPYFTSAVVGDSVRGQSLWGYGQATAGIAIALLGPVLGAVADAGGPRKPWILAFQALCIAAMFALWWSPPGADSGTLIGILALVVCASIAAEFSIVFNNAMLPTLESEDRLGRLSGYGWAAGYAGGLIALFFVLLAFSLPEVPLFGLDKAAHEHDRIVGPLSAVWMAVFLVPFILFTPDRPRSPLRAGQVVITGLADLKRTLAKALGYKNVLLFLIARMAYQDGLSAVFAFGGIYAAGIFGWTITNLGIFGIILTMAAGIGAVLGGHLDDRLGAKLTIQISLWGLIIGTIGVVSISTEALSGGGRIDTVLFFLSFENASLSPGAMFQSRAEWVFLIFGILIGICGGPVQAASRAMVARLVPPHEIGKFYGLYALSGKATAFAAPFTVAWLTAAYASQRAGVAVIIVFFAAGFLLLLPVRQERVAEDQAS